VTYFACDIKCRIKLFSKTDFTVRMKNKANFNNGINNQINTINYTNTEQDGLAVASIARDDPSTLPSHDPFPCARMHRNRNAR